MLLHLKLLNYSKVFINCFPECKYKCILERRTLSHYETIHVLPLFLISLLCFILVLLAIGK